MQHDTTPIAKIRNQAMTSFTKLGFPDTSLETWRLTDLEESFNRGYDYHLRPMKGVDVQKVFRCNIPHLDTAVIGLLNGWYVSKDVPLMELGNGIIMGSLAEARKQYPQLIEKYFGTMADDSADGFTALNTAFTQDGVFIYVPDNVKSPKPVQLINVIHHEENLFLQSRNLIVVSDNAKLSLVHCDDSYNHQASFSNIVTEIHVGEHGVMDHYKLQNLNNNSTLISSVFFLMEASASLESHYISLNGGLLRNNIRLLFNGPHGNANIYEIGRAHV